MGFSTAELLRKSGNLLYLPKKHMRTPGGASGIQSPQGAYKSHRTVLNWQHL